MLRHPTSSAVDLRATAQNTDIWTEVLTKLRPELKRRRNSIQINIIRSKSTLERIKSRVNLLHVKEECEVFSIFRFMQLPRKIRNRVYRELFDLIIPSCLVVRHPAYLTFCPEDTFPRILPALCYVNRQIYNECAAVVLKGRHIILPDLSAVKVLSDFLCHSSNLLFSSGIRSLIFSSDINWQPFATHTVRDLLGKCINLRHVRIEVAASACVQYDFDGGARGRGFHLRQKKHIIEQMDLCCLLDCRKLKTLTLCCVEGEPYAVRMGIRVEAIFKSLVLWVQQNICGSGKVRLRVEYELWGTSFSMP